MWKPHSNLDGVFERYIPGDGNKFHRQKVQDVAPILEHNTRVRNETNGRTKGGGRMVASIPATVYYDWIAEWTRKGLIGPGNMSGVNDLLIKRIRDRDFSKFRMTDGGV